jgi:hypothetical protein
VNFGRYDRETCQVVAVYEKLVIVVKIPIAFLFNIKGNNDFRQRGLFSQHTLGRWTCEVQVVHQPIKAYPSKPYFPHNCFPF